MAKDKRKELNEPRFGEKVEPILDSIEDAILERQEAKPYDRAKYSNDAFRSALCIFLDASFDKMTDYHDRLSLPYDAREKAILEYGNAIRLLIFKYCDIATEKL